MNITQVFNFISYCFSFRMKIKVMIELGIFAKKHMESMKHITLFKTLIYKCVLYLTDLALC